MTSKKQPDYITDTHLEYLDDLRDSGVVSMVLASPYIQREFGITRYEANRILLYWRESFLERKHTHAGD